LKNVLGGKLAFYAIGVVALLVIGASSVFAVGLLTSDGGRVDRALSPKADGSQAPEQNGPGQADKNAEKKVEKEAEAPPIDAVAPTDASMLSLTVPKMGRYNDMVMNDMSEATLDQGAGKLPSSGYPWQPGANTYIAAHVLGWEGTGSWLQFANLPNMTYGDMIYLTGADGTIYTYEVSEILTVTPYDVWVADPVSGRDMVSLQTCVGANYEWRLIVRGDRVA
jgi:sortase A